MPARGGRGDGTRAQRRTIVTVQSHTRAKFPNTLEPGRRWPVPKFSRDLKRQGPTSTDGVPILADVEQRAPGRRLAWSTAIFSLATGLSRVLGLVREIVAAYYFGAAGKINAFTVAFQVPNLLRSLVADAALSSAFVPVFSELLEKGDRKRAWRVASTLFWLMLLGLGGLTALFIVFAPLVIAPFDNPQIAITVFLENGNGGANAAPIGSRIMTYYFGRQQRAETR